MKQLPVAWAEANGRFTARRDTLFEALVISWLKEASISGVAELLHLSWTEAAGIQQRAVNRGLKRRRKQPLKQISIDESSFQKRHEYVTVVEVLDDRKAQTLEGWLRNKPAAHVASVESVTMDMLPCSTVTHRLAP